MADFRAKYKQKGLSFGDSERSRISRAEKIDNRRKEIRAQNFARLRPLSETVNTKTPGEPTSRNEKLVKWKAEKEMRKKTEKKIVKPPFKVGVVHHRIFSPPLTKNAGPSCSHTQPNRGKKPKLDQAPVKYVSRVTEKRLAAKAAARAAAKAAEKKSFAPMNHKFKAPTGLPNVPLFGRVEKGSMDASKLSFNFNEKIATVKSEIRKSSSNQRKKSNSLTRESPRRNKKLANFHEENESTISDTESISLRVSSDDPEVFDNPVAESSCINIGIQKKESILEETSFTFSKPSKLPSSSTVGEKNSHSSLSENEDLVSSKVDTPLKTDETDEILLRVSSDDPEVFDNPVAESSCINMGIQKKKSTLEETSFTFSKPSKLSSSTTVGEKNSHSSLSDNEDLAPSKVDSPHKTDETLDMPSESESNKMDTSLSESARKSLDLSQNIALFSPYVVTRRGKKEAREEQKIRRGFTRSPEEIPTKETIMQSLNISVEEEKRTSQYFKCLLESETNRLSEQCDIWNNIIINENPPEEAKAFVEQAIGQTKLLLRSKFKQFEGLVSQCEVSAGEHLVTCKDLQGFWDMMGMAVRDCESRFEKVEQLKSRGWKEEEEKMEKVEPKKIPVKKTLNLKKKSPSKKSPRKKTPAKSSLRAMILAARKKKKEMEENSEGKPMNEEIAEIWKNVVRDSPTKVTSTKRMSSMTSKPTTPKERRMSFASAAMAISQKCKTPEDMGFKSKIALKAQHEVEAEAKMNMNADVEIVNVRVHLDESISYINSKQTPGKSILKRFKLESGSDGSDDSRSVKSTQKVIFNDKVELKEVEVDEEARIKASLASALARIDSVEFDKEYVPEVRIRAEKKLNFEDESFNETENTSSTEDPVFDDEIPAHKTLMIPRVKVIPATPKSPRLNRKSKIDLENSIFENPVEEKEEEVTFTKSLRNRTIVSSLTPRSPRSAPKSPRNVPKSPRNVTKSPRNVAKSPRNVTKSQQNESFNSPKEGRTLRRRSLKQKEETEYSEEQDESIVEKGNESPIMKCAKIATRGTSLLYNLMKSPMSATKKSKAISNFLENLQIDPATPEESQSQKKEKTKAAEKIHKEKMVLNESNSTPTALAKLFAIPHDLSQTKSPRQRRKKGMGAKKLSVEESMEVSSISNDENLPKINKMQVDDEEETENSVKEKLTNSFERKNSKKQRNNGDVLNEKNTNHKDSKRLNLSVEESKIPKYRTPRRSLRIPEIKLPIEKENF